MSMTATLILSERRIGIGLLVALAPVLDLALIFSTRKTEPHGLSS